jgi:hypothetical protein
MGHGGRLYGFVSVCVRERECVELACRGKRTKRIPLPTPVSS